MKRLYLINNSLYVSYSFLKANKVSQKDLENWSYRKVSVKKIINGETCILFDSIPETKKLLLPSKMDLIAEYNLQFNEQLVEHHFSNIQYAHTKGHIRFIDTFKLKYPGIERKKINAAAKLYAVWLYILERAGRDTLALYSAFNKIYPGKYCSYNSFANAKSKASKEGAEVMAVDQRWFTTPQNIKKVTIVNQYWATSLISIGKKYSNRIVWKKLCELCIQSNETPPSLAWVHKYRKDILKRNYSVFESRNGKDLANAMQQTFATMRHALYANDQWQMDGWTLPFWVNGYKRYVIVLVRDAHSKKIIGSSVGESENTSVILAALRKAIINTGCLPFEILTDNHSFNKTKEAEFFKAGIEAIGTTYTITHSPTHKSIIERYNRHLDTLCKEYYGYVGQGIKSKNIDARPKQELLDLYGKYSITEDEVKLIGINIVEDFNNDILPKEGKTPNQLFEESEKPNCFTLTVFDRIKILTAKTECKILRGQITIKRGIEKHEFQLPSSLHEKYNNRTVIVRYEELKDGVYLYDTDTDEAIVELQPKAIIHGAKANQTKKDIELLNKNKGRLNGIKSKSKKKNEQLTIEALQQNPEAYELLNKITTPKSVLKSLEEKSHIKRIAIDEGIRIDNLEISDRESELDNQALQPIAKSKESPFSSNDNLIRKISMEQFYDQ